MSKSFINFALITLLVVTGCTSQAQFLANKQPTAIQAAVTRGQFEMNCPNATGQVLSQEVTQPAIQGPYLQGEERGLFTIGVAGCDQRRVYQVFCPVGGDSCTALEGRHGVRGQVRVVYEGRVSERGKSVEGLSVEVSGVRYEVTERNR